MASWLRRNTPPPLPDVAPVVLGPHETVSRNGFRYCLLCGVDESLPLAPSGCERRGRGR